LPDKLKIVQSTTKIRDLAKNFNEGELEKSFSMVEIYLATFPGDLNVERASVDLIACVLKAIELVIAYFLSHICEIS
jgi:hypothetical protein